jgi:hypothetical protein
MQNLALPAVVLLPLPAAPPAQLQPVMLPSPFFFMHPPTASQAALPPFCPRLPLMPGVHACPAVQVALDPVEGAGD